MGAPMEKNEINSLYSAIQGFVGKWWNGFRSLSDPSSPPSTSVTTESWEFLAGSLESLEFRSNPGLIGQIPTTFGRLRKLQSLVLVENGLSGELPANLGDLVNLRRLVLAGNKLSGGIPGSIADLKAKILGLNDNKLNRANTKSLENLPNASAIYLYGNNLTGELQFSEWFYGKMGRRFGAYRNPNLCYPFGLMSTSHVPFGVEPCQQELNFTIDLEAKSKFSKWDFVIDQNSHSSMGSLDDYGIWRSFLVQLFMVILLLLN
ncbi:hypothetical protein HAX54_017372 [Datura stramonium]|uniref:Uncharacterized protein n=1 Tax=Datura stramonium TaxID=4076 RepID=A0ABS8S0M2_DATST|nr:hypothetical protein [Datura stramonium]